MEHIKTLFQEALVNALPSYKCKIILDRPKSWEMGDFAFPCFAVGKATGRDPKQVANELAEKITIRGSELVAIGPYLNLRLQPATRARILLESMLRSVPYGSSKHKQKTVVIEYSSPNIAKLFTIGHLRSTMIGHSLVRINSYLGYNVVSINHLGDWGTQFGTLLAAYKAWAEQDNPELLHDFSWAEATPVNMRSPLYRLFQLYVRFHEAEQNNPALHDEAKSWFVRLEAKDIEAIRLWTWFRQISIIEFMRVYERLGVVFDSMDMGEAFYQERLKSVLNLLDCSGLLTLGEGGAYIIDLQDVGIKTPCLVQKSDGSSIYATRDIAAALYRREMWNFDKCLYVVGGDQVLHFKQLFAVMEKVDPWYSGRMVHVPFGMISLPDGKMSTRKGNVIFLEDVLDEAVLRVKAIIEEKNPNLSNKDAIAEMLGVGAVIFFNALNDRLKPITFTWDRIIALDGDTGPYVQYAHARILSVLRKAGYNWVDKARPSAPVNTNSAIITYLDVDVPKNLVGLENGSAQNLLFELAGMPEAYQNMHRENMGTAVARQLLCIAKAFSSFYTNCPILWHENSEDVRCSRLTLCVATARVLRQGLWILGVQAPEAM